MKADAARGPFQRNELREPRPTLPAQQTVNLSLRRLRPLADDGAWRREHHWYTAVVEGTVGY